MNAIARGGAPGRWSRSAPWLVAIGLFTLASRLVALPGSTPANMNPDSAHFLNVARCFARGQGFSNTEAWPAWVKPDSLPLPETFKEPGYPWAIARLAPRVGGPFRAGILISLVGGLALPFLTFALARRMGLAPAVAGVAGLLTAASPLLIAQSVRVMVDSIFPAFLTAAFALAAFGSFGTPRRTAALDVAAGALFGVAFLLRSQTLVASIAMLALVAARPPVRRIVLRVALMLAAALLVASPLLARNLRLFGTPFFSNVGSYGIWPYVDHLTFSHGLDRPPAPIAFALTHLPQVLAHMASSAVVFVSRVLPREILGNALWELALAAGVALSVPRWRTFYFVWIYLACTFAFIFAVTWDARYFVSVTPFLCILAALGAAWVWTHLSAVPLVGRVRGDTLLVATVIALLPAQAVVARHAVARYHPAEIDAARALGPSLHRALAPGEAVLVVSTSFYSWFADRPAVHLVIADEARFDAVMQRLRVRLAALPTSRLPEFRARYPGGRLPRSLVPLRSDPALDVSLFRVEPGAASGPARAATPAR